MAEEYEKNTEPEIGKFYFLRRPLEDIEEDVVTGSVVSSRKEDYTVTPGVLCYRGKSGDSLEFLQAIELPIKEGREIRREIKSMILYQTPEINYDSKEENIIHLKSRDGTSKEYKGKSERFEELKEEYTNALEREDVKDTSELIKKLKSKE